MVYLVFAAVLAVAAYLVFGRKGGSQEKPSQDEGGPSGLVVTASQPKPTYQDGGADAWEGWDYMGGSVASSGKELARRLKIRFTDRDGQTTEREIDTKKFLADEKDGVIQAYCHLRQANRPFRLSQVSYAVDLETGEVLKNLPAWLAAQYAGTARGKADAFIDEHGDALAALFFVAKADGAFRQAERAHLSELCMRLGAPSVEVAEVVVGDVGGWAVPSAIGYGKALRAVAGKPEEYRHHILETARKMVDSDKTTKEEETKALGRMLKELGLKVT